MDKIKRFTSKYSDSTPVYHKYYLNGYHYEQGEFIDKLGRIEDIEEETGISLDILFKACKDGFYYKDCGEYISYACKQNNANIYFNSTTLIYLERNYVDYLEIDVDYYALKDYGKTWALTREELENG